MQSELMEGTGLPGRSTPVSPPDYTRSQGRRTSDIEAIAKMHSLETQMAVVETQLEHLGERLEDTQRELKEDIERVDGRITDMGASVNRQIQHVIKEVKQLIDEHTVEERASTEAKYAKLADNFDTMQKKADARHLALKEIATAQKETTELLSIIKGGAIKVGLSIIVGGGIFTVSSIGYIITHIDTINRIIDNLTKVP